LFEIFALVYWGIRIRLDEAMENARLAALKSGRTPSADVGRMTKLVRAWRALGRTLCDIQMLVFNVGRADFRNKHYDPFAKITQASKQSGLGLHDLGLRVSMDMLASLGALVDMRGIVLVLERILAAASGARAASGAP